MSCIGTVKIGATTFQFTLIPEFETTYMKTTISKHCKLARTPDPLACHDKTKLISLGLLINNGYCFCTKSLEGGWGGGPNQTRNRRKGTVSVISHDPPFKKRAWA